MKTTPGIPRTRQLFREIGPGTNFQAEWHGKVADYLTTDLIRAAPDSSKPWDRRAAVNLETGETVWFADDQTVTPTIMQAGPA